MTKKLLYAMVLLGSLSTLAAARDLQNLGRDGVALQGYDPVAFFTDHQPVKGSPQFQSDYRGAKYYFASADHKAAFLKAPAQYEPQFGGYCAYGASRGKTAPVKIEAWQIVNGRLLMQYDLGVRTNSTRIRKAISRRRTKTGPASSGSTANRKERP